VTFETLKNDLKAKLKTHDGCDAKLKRELAAFRELVERLGQFASAALVQGRKIYRPGTPERALIDAVPTAPSTQAPAQAQITVAESPSFGAVRLVVEAEHATSFEIWRKGPADEEFVKVADVLKPGDYTDSGLDAGDYEFKAFGVNSRGEGPVSAVVTVTVEVETVPAQAEFTLAESPAPGAAHLEIVSDGATTFHILHKGPGMAQFALVANLSANGSVDYVSSNLAAGVHEFKARGLNAQGTGAESEVVVLEVEAQQAA